MREDSNGNLFMPRRGKPPEQVPDGYIRGNDPFVFVWVAPVCLFRETRTVVSCCGPDKQVTVCQNSIISMKECKRCQHHQPH